MVKLRPSMSRRRRSRSPRASNRTGGSSPTNKKGHTQNNSGRSEGSKVIRWRTNEFASNGCSDSRARSRPRRATRLELPIPLAIVGQQRTAQVDAALGLIGPLAAAVRQRKLEDHPLVVRQRPQFPQPDAVRKADHAQRRRTAGPPGEVAQRRKFKLHAAEPRGQAEQDDRHGESAERHPPHPPPELAAKGRRVVRAGRDGLPLSLLALWRSRRRRAAGDRPSRFTWSGLSVTRKPPWRARATCRSGNRRNRASGPTISVETAIPSSRHQLPRTRPAARCTTVRQRWGLRGPAVRVPGRSAPAWKTRANSSRAAPRQTAGPWTSEVDRKHRQQAQAEQVPASAGRLSLEQQHRLQPAKGMAQHDDFAGSIGIRIPPGTDDGDRENQAVDGPRRQRESWPAARLARRQAGGQAADPAAGSAGTRPGRTARR